jgi:HPt (histidine-containing phosphotransfer) domain-containing protein
MDRNPVDTTGVDHVLDLSNPAFREVFERFKTRLGENGRRLRQLEDAVAPDAEQVLVEIRQIAHRLAGAAGTFGFSAVGASATTLERLLSESRCEPDTVRAQVRHLLAAIDGREEATER